MTKFKFNLSKSALIGYVCIIIASSGYYGYYIPEEDSIIWSWVVLAIIGIIILGYKNFRYYKLTKDSRVFWDIVITLLVFCIPLIPFPYGLSILLMMAICVSISLILVNSMFHPWKKNNSSSDK